MSETPFTTYLPLAPRRGPRRRGGTRQAPPRGKLLRRRPHVAAGVRTSLRMQRRLEVLTRQRQQPVEDTPQEAADHAEAVARKLGVEVRATSAHGPRVLVSQQSTCDPQLGLLSQARLPVASLHNARKRTRVACRLDRSRRCSSTSCVCNSVGWRSASAGTARDTCPARSTTLPVLRPLTSKQPP